MRSKSFVSAAMLACTCLSAQAQTPAGFVGNWTATWQGERRPFEAKVVLTSSGGTWKTAAANRNDPCVGIEAPVAVMPNGDDDAGLRLKFSEALAGCQDVTMSLHKVDDKTLSGTRGKMPVTLTRN